jgi:hypothetical protein
LIDAADPTNTNRVVTISYQQLVFGQRSQISSVWNWGFYLHVPHIDAEVFPGQEVTSWDLYIEEALDQFEIDFVGHSTAIANCKSPILTSQTNEAVFNTRLNQCAIDFDGNEAAIDLCETLVVQTQTNGANLVVTTKVSREINLKQGEYITLSGNASNPIGYAFNDNENIDSCFGSFFETIDFSRLGEPGSVTKMDIIFSDGSCDLKLVVEIEVN